MATSCRGETSWWRIVLTRVPSRLPEPHLFDEREGRLAQFGQLGQRDQRRAETLPFHKRRVRLHVRVERIFLVEVREQLLAGLRDEEFHEQFGVVQSVVDLMMPIPATFMMAPMPPSC